MNPPKSNKNQNKNKKRVEVIRKVPNNTKKIKINQPGILQSVDTVDPIGKQLSSIVEQGYGATLKMYPSVVNFASVYADPFTTLSARIPMLPLLPSKLIRVSAAGNGVISNASTGWVYGSPEDFCTNTSSSCYYNTNTSGPNFGSGSAIPIQSNSPYSYASFTYNVQNALSMRCVAFGIRVRYQGTVFNASGDWYACQTVPRIDLNGISTASIQNIPGNKTGQFRGPNWNTYCRQLNSNSDFNYLSNIVGTGWVDATTGTQVYAADINYIGIIFSGTIAQPYEWEIVGHYELVGPNLDYTGLGNPHTDDTEKVVKSFSNLRHKDRTTRDHVSNVPNKTQNLVKVLKDGVEKQFPLVGDRKSVV